MAVSFNEYLRRSQYDPTLRGRETQDIQSALQAVSQYQTNRAVGEVFGVDADAQPREGILRRFGRILDAPRRALSAGALDLIGYDDPRLAGQNPLQSALAGFRGDINITGGDVFRLTGRESFPEKALKLGGAFAFDVGLDPLVYIGTPAALGRKSAATMAARTAQRTFTEAVEQTAKATKTAPSAVESKLVDDLFKNTAPGRLWQEGDPTLRRYVFGPTDADVRAAAGRNPSAQTLKETRERLMERTIDNMSEETARNLGLIGRPDTPATLAEWKLNVARSVGMLDEAGNVLTSSQWKRQLVQEELGRILGESLYAQGRVGLRRSLEELTGSKEAAEAIFRNLPDRVKGGLYFANPFTGRSIARVTEGTGESLGAFGEAANRARLQVAAFFGKGTQHFSGTKGQAFQMVRSDLAKLDRKASLVRLYGTRTQTLSGYLGIRTSERLAKLATIPGMRELNDVASDIAVIRKASDNVEAFDADLVKAFYREGAASSVAEEAAGRLRMILINQRERMIRAGIDVGDLGEGYIPVQFTREGRNWWKVNKALAEGAPLRTTGAASAVPYDPSRGRRLGFAVTETVEEASDYAINLGRGLVALDPKQLNMRHLARQLSDIVGDNPAGQQTLKDFFDNLPSDFVIPPANASKEVVDAFNNKVERLLTRAKVKEADLSGIVYRVFEDDPITLISRYVVDSNKRIAASELITQGLRLGILTRSSSDVTTELNQRQTAEFVASLRELSERVQNRIAVVAKGDSSFQRKVADLTPEQLEAIGLLSPEKMTALIRRLDMQSYLPESALQEAALYEAVSVWARLNYAVQTGQRLTVTQQARKNAAKSSMDNAAKVMENADRTIQALDDMFAELMGVKGFTERQVREIATIVSSEYGKMSRAGKFSVGAVEAAGASVEDAAARVARTASGVDDVPWYWLPGGRQVPSRERVLAATSEQDFKELLDLERFLLTSKSFNSKTSNKDIEDLVKKFYSKKDVQSPVDRAAELMGLGRIGARPSTEGVVSVGPALAELRAMQGVRQLMEAKQRVAGNPSAMAEFFEKVYDPMFLVWKNGATVGRGPGYTFLNMVGNLYMNMLGDVTVRDHRLSARVLQAATDAHRQAAEEVAARTGVTLSARESRALLGRRADEIMKETLSAEKVGDKTVFELWTDFINAGGVESSQIGEALGTIGKSGVDVTPEGLARALNRVRVSADETTATRRVESVVNAFMNNPYQRFANTVNTNVETWTRFASFIDGYRASGSIDMAMERMYLLQFNYGDLSRMDQAARRVFPFYVWTRNNVPAQFRAMFVQPGKIRRMMAAQEAFKNALIADEEDAWLQEVLPDYIGEVGGFASAIMSGPYNVAFASKLPYDDVDRLIQFGGRFGLTLNSRDIGQMLGPYTLGLEAIFQRDFSTGGAFNPLGREAVGWRRALGAVPGIGKTGRYGETRIPVIMDKLLSELVPQIGTAERALSGLATATRGAGSVTGVDTETLARVIESPTSASMRERGMSNLLNVSGISPLLGVSATTLTPRTVSSTLRERRNRQLAVINEAAGRAGISLDWVRQQLQAGFSPEEIAAMIMAGQGDLERFEQERADRAGGANPRYEFLLRQLAQGGPVTDLGY